MRSTGRVIDTTYPLVASGHATEVKLTMPREWLRSLLRRNPTLFTHWALGPAAG